MSGFEIAGLVLGAFPVLLHALEGYRIAAEGATEWKNIEDAYQQCEDDLLAHQSLFQETIELLLLPVVSTEDELQALLADPAGAGWHDKVLDDKLRQRIPRSYIVFLNTMKKINKLVDRLSKEVGVKDVHFRAKVQQHSQVHEQTPSRQGMMSRTNLLFQAKRILFTTRKSTRIRIFDKLEKSNNRLRDLLRSSDEVKAARQQQEPQTSRLQQSDGSYIHAMIHSPPPTITLKQLISSPRGLTLQRRYQVAFTLAKAYLQPSAASWLNTHLRSEAIHFLHDPSEPQSALLSSPFCRQTFVERSTATTADAIRGFGTRLLELCYGRLLEDSLQRKRLSPEKDRPSTLLDYIAAVEWSRGMEHHGGMQFAKAVRWCLNVESALSNESWKAEFTQNVLVPLRGIQDMF
ncbi:hypothetical protein CC86DRAFT_371164 [Ophiobolus disseminans]|uniref:DUF7580 domain-containing protein n=1 Tax=Ophiobolus disseminans TaxID=1469910 RepID=A0A6A6ZYN7_9PLEO|nr:hypothetical protein CC86DRAFT_371164 [Ophiobolus disseminans]